ncbi:MAG: hypothetical protein RSE61_07250 [Anaerovoracaceae bacterium]
MKKKLKRKMLAVVLSAFLILQAAGISPVYAVENDKIDTTTKQSTSNDKLQSSSTTEGSTWLDHAATQFASGNGTLESPYLISNAEELAYLAKISNDKTFSRPNTENKFFKLTENIDLSQYQWVPIGRSGWNISEYDGQFYGYFDGNGKTIIGMNVDETSTECYAGLFGAISGPNANQASLIKDLTIKNATIKTNVTQYDETNCGILVGSIGTLSNSANNTLVENINVSGNIIKNAANKKGIKAGGVAGNAQHVTFNNCMSSTNIYGQDGIKTSYSGGLFGMLSNAVVNNSTALGKIENGTWTLGGVAAQANDSKLENCIANVNINGNDWRLGGFIGYASNAIANKCAAYGDVTFDNNFDNARTGGFFGEAESGKFTQCYSTGKVMSTNSEITVGAYGGYISKGVEIEGAYYDAPNKELKVIGVVKEGTKYDILKSDIAKIATLISNSITSTVPADYTKVSTAIEMANALKKDNYEDFSALESAINAVNFNKFLNEQYVVLGYAKSIEDAIAALQKKPAVPSDIPYPEYKPIVSDDGKIEVTVNKPDENGKVEADVPDSAVNNALDKVIADVEAGNKENVVVEIKVNTDSKAEAVDVKVDSASIDKIAKTKNATLKVESNVGALELDNDVLKEISKNAGGGKVNISIEKPKVENMPAKQQETIKEIAKKGMVFNLSITAGDKKISNLGGIATLSVDYDLPENEVAEGVRVYFVNDNGEIKPVDAHYDAKSKKIVMSTDHFSVYAVSYVNVPTKVGILRTANDKGRASLRWSRATNDPEGYRVYRSATKDGKYKPIAWVKNGKAKTYKEKAKKTNKTYYYKVRAYKNMDGKKVWGGYSPIKVVKF